jgi:hypothetical protein
VELSLPELQAAVQEIQDREAIRSCLHRYARGVDRFDRGLLLSAFHSDAIDDHGKFIGHPVEFADWVFDQHAKTHLSHQHCLFNHVCDLESEVAHTETYFMFAGMNRQGPPWSVLGGRYLDRFEKRNGVWAIAYRLTLRDWALIDERVSIEDQSSFTSTRASLPPAIRAFMDAGLSPRRDLSDPSYQRPLQADPERLEAWARLDSARLGQPPLQPAAGDRPEEQP